jgi:cephalosporin-C deacetylase-like acetyl esterase
MYRNQMRTSLFAGIALAFAGIAYCQPALVVDGALDDPFWRDAEAQALAPQEAGVPATGGEVRARLSGSSLCVSARLPEAGGRILARSFGRNPVWEKDALESPEVEDRIEFEAVYRNLAGSTRTVRLAVNPWGAYRAEESSKGVMPAARIGPDGWTVEAAIPLTGLTAEAGPVDVRARRIRARRPLAPEYRWTARQTLPVGSVQIRAQPPAFQPPRLGNTEPPLEIGRVPQVPGIHAVWEDPAWRSVPAFELPRNEPYPRRPRYRTGIKWVHDGKTLALLVRLEEPEPVVARAGGRDSNVTGDDHLAIYLATTGSRFLEIAVNSVGAIRDARAAGPHGMRPGGGWDADIEVRTDIRHGAWVARVNLPLQQLAVALGEPELPPEWRILIARHRARRRGEAAESSALPPIGASTFYGPLRYRRLVLRDAAPEAAARIPEPWMTPPAQGLARELALLDPHVWTSLERRWLGAAGMLETQQRRRAEQAVWAERQAWDKVHTRAEWERFRDERMAAFRESVGQFPPERPPLDVRTSARHAGKGYRLENIAFQSRPGYYVTANLYLPERPAARMPAIVIVHSQHYPKTQGELHDMGELWARTGAAVLVIERPGYGERAETSTWYRQAYASRFTFSKQLFLAGESYSGWVAWDIIRAVDLLHERTDIDQDRIVLLGAVAGGGEPAALAAALDKRIDAVAPFNYDQGHIRVHGDSPGQIARQFSPWLIAASVAPRRFIRAFEFGWEGAEEHDYPSLWVDGMARSKKVWDFYGAGANLASSQAYGLIRLSMERVSHCFSIGPQQRVELYPHLQRWFDIPFPSQEDLSILPDSQLSTNPVREQARAQEATRRRPHADLLSITPELAAKLNRRQMHEIARDLGAAQLAAARRSGRPLPERLAQVLGDTAPGAVRAEIKWARSLSGAEVEGAVLEIEGGIPVPMMILRPKTAAPAPLVIAVAQGGKSRFLANRAPELARLIAAGIAVCLPDVRGTGETSPSEDRNRDGGAPHGLAQREFDLAGNLLGARLQDLRTVLAYLRTRKEFDRERMGVWGDSFAPANSPELRMDELEYEVSPLIQHRSEPLGALLAVLIGLYENDVRAIAGRGGLSSYLSVLESPFTYTPMDVVLWGILKAGDIEDLVGALAPRPVLYADAVNGRNVMVGADGKPADLAVWLMKQLARP